MASALTGVVSRTSSIATSSSRWGGADGVTAYSIPVRR